MLCSAIAGSASARNLSQNEQRFRTTYSPLSFIPSFGSTIRCPLTLEGSLHSRTIAKVAGSLIGYVNRVVFGTCEAGRLRANTETLPWHVTYESFSGTLPLITSLGKSIHNMSFEIDGEIFGLAVRCRYNMPSERFTTTREARGVLTGETPGSETVNSSTEGCPSYRLSGTGSVKTPTGANIVVTLI